jgi:hypothetical protein
VKQNVRERLVSLLRRGHQPSADPELKDLGVKAKPPHRRAERRSEPIGRK